MTERVQNIRAALGVCPECGQDHRLEVLATARLNGLRLLPILDER